METTKHVLQMIKGKVLETEPDATVILFGSFARGQEHEDSDMDILILVEREKEVMSWDEKMKVLLPVSRLEWEINTPISPIVYSKKGWANHQITPFFENVNKEGITL